MASDSVAKPVAHALSRMVDLAWAAGVLDSRAQWVAIPRRAKHGETHTMRVRVRGRISQEGMLTRLRDVLGGNVSRHKQRMEWQVSGAKGCIEVFEEIGPYLRDRGRTAQAHAELCKMIRDYKPEGLDRTLPPEILAARGRLIAGAQVRSGVIVSPRTTRHVPLDAAVDDEDDIPF